MPASPSGTELPTGRDYFHIPGTEDAEEVPLHRLEFVSRRNSNRTHGVETKWHLLPTVSSHILSFLGQGPEGGLADRSAALECRGGNSRLQNAAAIVG